MDTQIPAQLRPTRQREAILRLLDEVEDFHSAQELHVFLREQGEHIGLATIYRTLQLLVAAGEVDIVHGSGHETMYRRCSPTDHHHLVCRGCHRTIEIPGPTLDAWADELAREHGFVDIAHTVEVMGTCADCVPQPAAPQPEALNR